MNQSQRMIADLGEAGKKMTLTDLPPKEQAVAKKMIAKDNTIAIQFVNPDGKDFGDPVYFKSAGDVGPFMRQNPELKQKWVINLGSK